MRHVHHWSVEEANALCPVRRGAASRACAPRASGCAAPRARSRWSPAAPGPGREHAQAAVELVLTLEQLEELEIIVRDLDAGLVDFPALRDGEEVYLCWLVDEPEIAHWHLPGAGFPGRRPL